MSLYWHRCGEGKTDLVLLHGWGLNAEVWSGVLERLKPHFRLHLVDLPGYGRSQGYSAMTLEEMTGTLLPHLPENALIAGWSLGGLVATRVVQTAPQKVRGLVTISSSPCFSERELWPGIKPTVLEGFRQQLSLHFEKTVERFMALQTLGTGSARQDARQLREVILSQPLPSADVLNGGLSILQSADLRAGLSALKVPVLRIYGALDALVPVAIVPKVDQYTGHGQSLIIPKAGHAPFISHPELFCQQLIDFSSDL